MAWRDGRSSVSPSVRRLTRVWWWLLDRAAEPSSWRGAAVLLGAVGVVVSPDQVEAVVTGVAVVVGVVEIAREG